jgi:hypothetical protein
LSIEPGLAETRMMLSRPSCGAVLRARLPTPPAQPAALGLFLQGLAAWLGQGFCAVLDAESEDVRRHPERWARLLGDVDSQVFHVEWVAHTATRVRRDRFLDGVGDFRRGRRLITFAATGQR